MRENVEKGSLIGAVILVLVGLLLGGGIWWNKTYNTYFQDITLELGAPLPEATAFLKAGAKPRSPRILTDLQTLDWTKPGEHSIILETRFSRETVVLTIEDTTAPQVVFQDIMANLDTELIPEMFVESAYDLSPTTILFAEKLQKSDTYSQVQVKLMVVDPYGNKTEGECTVTYVWMYPELTLELGEELTKEKLLLSPQKDAQLLDQNQLDEINNAPVGTYTVTSNNGEHTCESVITLVDTIAPELKLKAVKMDSNQTLKIEHFVSKASDASGVVELSYQETPDHTKEGNYTVTIIATDANGNTTRGETTLKVSYDTTPPVFSGVSAIKVKRGTKPNYTKGVKAKDSRDGEVTFTCDTSKVNIDKTGTYYAIYTATDSSGNKATYRRKVTVGHGPEDTSDMVKEIAAKLDSNVQTLSNWVRKNVKYNHNWGGDDPIWYGLKNKKGNCYVHAKILDALLKLKGYNTQLIWVTDKSHYWNIVYVDGAWRHVDSTPGTRHPAYLMNDTERYAHLQGRNWDRDKWPKCE